MTFVKSGFVLRAWDLPLTLPKVPLHDPHHLITIQSSVVVGENDGNGMH